MNTHLLTEDSMAFVCVSVCAYACVWRVACVRVRARVCGGWRECVCVLGGWRLSKLRESLLCHCEVFRRQRYVHFFWNRLSQLATARTPLEVSLITCSISKTWPNEVITSFGFFIQCMQCRLKNCAFQTLFGEVLNISILCKVTIVFHYVLTCVALKPP